MYKIAPKTPLACFALFLLASPARAEVSVLTSIKPLQLVAAAI